MNRPYHRLPWYRPPVVYADQHTTRSTYSARVNRADERLRRLLATAPAIGIHDHPFLLPANLDAENWGNWRRDKRLEYAYEAMASSGVTAAVASTNSWHTAAEIETILPRFLADLAHHDGFHPVSRFADLTAGAAPDGGMPTSVGVILGLESMTEFGHDLDAVERLFGLGVRVGGLIYSDGNLLGGGLSSAYDEGLTRQGRAILRQMNEVGMVADFAHAGDRTTLEAIEASTVPVMISHAGSRSLWPTSRMKPDDVIKALADTGGIIGVEAPPNSTCVPGQEGHTIDQVMAHVERIIELVGVDAVALGLDVTFGPHHQLHMIRAAAPHRDTRPVDGLPRATYVDGLENPEEGFWNAGWWLIDHGYADEDIRKILGGNALRYFRTVMPG